jgi:uncharacterized Fe-S cluster protein YjdI
MEKIRKKYTNGEITIIWEPKLCDHSSICYRSLPKVFKLSERPWIDPNAATTLEIIKTVDRCPTKALTYELNKDVVINEENSITKITILQDGPYLVDGNIKVLDYKGNEIVYKRGIALCRCGASKNKPFCDGIHSHIGFKD